MFLFSFVATIFIIFLLFNRHSENFSAGQLCNKCNGLNFADCTDCFNCGFCIDKYGNGKCLPGDYKGSYDSIKCNKWYHHDPWSQFYDYNCVNKL